MQGSLLEPRKCSRGLFIKHGNVMRGANIGGCTLFQVNRIFMM